MLVCTQTQFNYFKFELNALNSIVVDNNVSPRAPCKIIERFVCSYIFGHGEHGPSNYVQFIYIESKLCRPMGILKMILNSSALLINSQKQKSNLPASKPRSIRSIFFQYLVCCQNMQAATMKNNTQDMAANANDTVCQFNSHIISSAVRLCWSILSSSMV